MHLASVPDETIADWLGSVDAELNVPPLAIDSAAEPEASCGSGIVVSITCEAEAWVLVAAGIAQRRLCLPEPQ